MGLWAWAAIASAATEGWYRFPAIRGDDVVFTAEGDLWRVPVAGGTARRLTTHAGQETNASISPDGKLVAFSAEIEGPTEAWVMPLDGGAPRRLTWDGDRAVVKGFLPDGRVLVATRRHSTLPDWQLVAIHPDSGATERIPLAQASEAAFDGTGALWFTRLEFQGSHTRRYKGGTAQQLWRWKPGTEATPLTADFAGTSKAPMLHGGALYFASDRDGAMNLWRMGLDGASPTQLTRHVDFDVQSPDLDRGRIAYQLGPDLRIYDIASGADRRLDVTLGSDLEQTRERWIDDPLDWVSAIDLSGDGDRIALTARGSVFVAPVEPGRLARLTRTTGVRWRDAAFMANGDVVAWGDVGPEYALHRFSADGLSEPRSVSDGSGLFEYRPAPTPKGELVAWVDQDYALWVTDLSNGDRFALERNPNGAPQDLAWSPDGRWLAWASPAANSYTVLRLWSRESPTPVDLTTDRVATWAPAWAPDGSILYALSDRDLESIVPSPWGWWQPEPFMDRTTGIYGLRLRNDVKWPWRHPTELEPKDEGSDDEDDDKKDKKKKSSGADEGAVRVDLAGLADRIERVGSFRGNFGALAAGKDALFLHEYSRTDPGLALKALEIDPDAEMKELRSGVEAWKLSDDGGKLLVRDDDAIWVVDAATSLPDDLDKHRVDLSALRLTVQPRDEWRQMVREAWRMERDFFYDPGLHGVDWDAQLARFLPLVDRVTDRAELSDLIAQMVSELSALHIFVFGGDHRGGPEHVDVAALGARLSPVADGIRIDAIYRSDPDWPEERGPLQRPGVDVRVGDVIVAVDGTPTAGLQGLGALLRGKADQPVRLGLKRGRARHDTIVRPDSASAEADRRYDDWELTRRERVEQRGKGRIGYLHLRAMGTSNWTEFVRGFYPVFQREGLIIDVRHNRGGNIDSWILEKLMRKAWMYWQWREGAPAWNMQYAFRGKLAVLVDGHTASDGEAFAEGIKRLELGEVFGTRTWGGEIWLSFDTWLVDSGIATAAEYGVYGPEGTWLVEGHGVEPDHVVDNLPHATFLGSDAQLDAAVDWLLAEIQKDPMPVPPAPEFPDKSAPRR
jgi:tricorn protease